MYLTSLRRPSAPVPVPVPIAPPASVGSELALRGGEGEEIAPGVDCLDLEAPTDPPETTRGAGDCGSADESLFNPPDTVPGEETNKGEGEEDDDDDDEDSSVTGWAAGLRE